MARNCGETRTWYVIFLLEKQTNNNNVAASPTNNITIKTIMSNAHNRWLQKILVSATLSLDIEHLQTWNLRCPLLFKATATKSEQVSSNDGLLVLPPNLSQKVVGRIASKHCFLSFYLRLCASRQ